MAFPLDASVSHPHPLFIDIVTLLGQLSEETLPHPIVTLIP